MLIWSVMTSIYFQLLVIRCMQPPEGVDVPTTQLFRDHKMAVYQLATLEQVVDMVHSNLHLILRLMTSL